MKTQVIEGSPQEIAEKLSRMNGSILQVVLFWKEAADPEPIQPGEDIFVEMEPFTVKVGGADYSREALYTPAEGE